MIESRCKECGGEVILIEGWSLEAVGYGYGTFKCLDCKKESSYYGEGLITIEIKKKEEIMPKTYKGINTGPGPQGVIVIAGEEKYSLRHILRHSPDGFQWGYAGSGPAELARCILIDLLGMKKNSLINGIYQEFKRKFIESADDDLLIKEEDIRKWLSDEFHI